MIPSIFLALLTTEPAHGATPDALSADGSADEQQRRNQELLTKIRNTPLSGL